MTRGKPLPAAGKLLAEMKKRLPSADVLRDAIPQIVAAAKGPILSPQQLLKRIRPSDDELGRMDWDEAGRLHHALVAIELARRGHTMTAVDLSQEFLDAARVGADTSGVAVDFRYGDMRALELPETAFDGAYCLGNSFGYLNRTNAETFLQRLIGAEVP